MVRAGVVTSRQRRSFIRNGFVVIPRVVDRQLTDDALRSINHWLDAGYETTRRFSYREGTFAPELVTDPTMFALIRESPAMSLACDLVGGPLELPETAQIALRFPAGRTTEPDAPPHLDGVPTALNVLPLDGTLHGFTLLACILLSDLPEPGNGNFRVWPGSHRVVADWFADRGLAVDDAPEFGRECERVASGTSGPVPVTGRTGDLLLAHYLLLHAAGANNGPHIRYAVFFRLTLPNHDALGDRAYTDPWAGWRSRRHDTGRAR